MLLWFRLESSWSHGVEASFGQHSKERPEHRWKVVLPSDSVSHDF